MPRNSASTTRPRVRRLRPAPRPSRPGRSRGAPAGRLPALCRCRCADRRTTTRPRSSISCLNGPFQSSSGAVLAASAAIVALFCLRSSRLMRQERRSRLAGSSTLRSGVLSRMAGTTLPRNLSSTSMRLRRNCFGNDAVVERRPRLVAGLVAREDADRRVQVLVVGQREEGHLERRIGAGDAGPRRRKPGIDLVADADAATRRRPAAPGRRRPRSRRG